MEKTKINVKEIMKNGGATLDKNGEKFASDNGFMVSLYGKEFKTDDEQRALDKIEEYIAYIQEKKGLFVGVWVDNGYLYIDISIHIVDKVEALEFARKNKQLAIYDLKNNDSIYLKDYKFVKYYNIYKIIKGQDGNIIDYKIIGQLESIKDVSNYFKLNKKTIKNSICNEFTNDLKQLIKGQFVVISDYMLESEF